VDEIEAVANDDEKLLIGQLGRFFQEILDFLRVVTVAQPTNLTSARGCLNILEVLLAKMDIRQ
jgi:hypothetical protein